MQRKNKKFKRYFKRNKYSKRYKISKKSYYYIQKILKIISIFIMIIAFCSIYKKEKTLFNNNNNNDNNNNWMKKI